MYHSNDLKAKKVMISMNIWMFSVSEKFLNSTKHLRYREEINVVEHLICLGIFSAKDHHEHGVFCSIVLAFAEVSWAQHLLEVFYHFMFCGFI